MSSFWWPSGGGVGSESDPIASADLATHVAATTSVHGISNTASLEVTGNKDTDGTLAANSDTKYASQKATKTYADTKLPSSYLDTDGTLAANSDVKVASQKAVKTYVDALPRLYVVVKTSTEGVTNSAALQDDDHLVLTLPAGRFSIDWNLLTADATTASDWKFGLSGTASTGGLWGAILTGTSATWGGTTTAQSPAALTSTVGAISLGAATVGGGFILRGAIQISVAGTLILQWAQNTATAGVTNTIYTGSNVVATKVT